MVMRGGEAVEVALSGRVLDILVAWRASSRVRVEEEAEVEGLSVNAGGSVVSSSAGSAGAPRGLDVVFGGVEVYEVKARLTGLRKAVLVFGLVLAAALTVAAWVRPASAPAAEDERASIERRNGVVVTGLSALYLIAVVRRTGAVWRFDHKRKTITRRHWLRGMSRSWTSKQVAGMRLFEGKGRLGGDVARLGLVDAGGALVVELGCWAKAS